MKKEKKKEYTNAEIGLLADCFGKSAQTINRWIKNNDDRLTSDKAKNVLKENRLINKVI